MIPLILKLVVIQKMREGVKCSLLKFAAPRGNGKAICQPSDFQWRQVGLGKGGIAHSGATVFILFLLYTYFK